MSRERFSFRFGAFSCMTIIDGREIRPITTLTNSVSPEILAQVLSEQGYSPTEVVSDYNVLFMDTGHHLVLVDSGWGSSTTKMQGRLLHSLDDARIAPGEIDLVVLTHSDRDHLAGLIDTQGKLTYSNATLVMSKEAWEVLHIPTNLARLPAELREFYQRVLPVLEGRVELVEGEKEIAPNITMLPAPGHRPGHTALRITLSGKHFLHLADAVGHPILMSHPEWRWPYDSDPEQAQATRRQLLGWAAREKALIFGSHLPFPGLGTVTSQGDGWLWQPIEEER